MNMVFRMLKHQWPINMFPLIHGRRIYNMSPLLEPRTYPHRWNLFTGELKNMGFFEKAELSPQVEPILSPQVGLVSIFWLFQKGEGKDLILSIKQGSAGLRVHCFPLKRDRIDGIFDVVTKCIKT